MGKSKKKEFTVTLYIGGKQVNELTEDQLDALSQKLSEVMSRYYSNHPEEYLKIKDNQM